MRASTIRKVSATTVVLALSVGGSPSAPAQEVSRPEGTRLILQITVDGLRGDLLHRYQHHFGEDGLRRLMDQGAYFTDAHYQHANTETIVGHSTLATGAIPSRHGMIGNVWWDRADGELAYNIEDDKYPLLASRENAVEGEQVDPSQARARTDGRSPRALLAPTFGDTLMAYSAGRSKVFGVSGKDRSAVSMAGKVGKAFWMSTDTGDFVTSRYYYDRYPEWVAAWNGERKVDALGGRQWALSKERSTYILGEQDDRPYEIDLRGYGRTFPHTFGQAGSELLPTQVLVSPYGDELLLDFTKALVEAEAVGADDVPDLLSISFSGVDAVNHFFGPSSLENEETVVRLDRTIAELLEFVDEKIGLDRTLVVFSADHGMAEMPEYMTELGHQVGRLYGHEVHDAANQAGHRLFGVKGLVKNVFRPYAYLDPEKIAAANLDMDEVADRLAAELQGSEGLAIAASRSQIAKATDGALLRIKNNHHSSRSGEIYLAQEPYWFFFEKGPIAAMHGSPWRYDTHVPVVFMGKGIDGRRVRRRIAIADVAPTMSAILGISAPAASEGTTLPEAIPSHR